MALHSRQIRRIDGRHFVLLDRHLILDAAYVLLQ